MAKPKPAAGEAVTCDQCGDAMAAHRAPTDAEWAAFTHKEQPGTLPVRVDTAPPAQRAKLGPLYECRGCGYRTRVKPEGDAPGADAAEA